MNKKILASLAAIVAVLGLIAGGTFAAYSDIRSVEDNTAGSGALVLNLTNGDGTAVKKFDYGKMAPGEQNQSIIHLANADLDYGVAPTANLYVDLLDLVGSEDGCTSATELGDQGTNYGSSCDAADVGTFEPEGQFRNEAIVELTHAITSAATCPAVVGGVYNVLPGQGLVIGDLQTVEDGSRLLVGELEDGESACLLVNIKMPAAPGFNNSAQGDSAVFDLKFDLEQS